MKQKTILFQGDSITDCNRFVHNDLGDGYVHYLAKMMPEELIMNKGISGNETSDLLNRWTKETIELHPDVLSILIGINDIWHAHADHTNRTVSDLLRDYRLLLERTKEALPETKILMIEPYLLVFDDFQKSWRHELDFAIQGIRDLAKEFADEYLPLDGLLAEARVHHPDSFLMWDGIHPTPEGHQLIASWIKPKLDLLLQKK